MHTIEELRAEVTRLFGDSHGASVRENRSATGWRGYVSDYRREPGFCIVAETFREADTQQEAIDATWDAVHAYALWRALRDAADSRDIDAVNRAVAELNNAASSNVNRA